MVFVSLVPSAGEGLGLGREGATSGTAKISTSEGRRNSEPSNKKCSGQLAQDPGGKKEAMGKE